jgi:CCR4-NOT complex subunit CAF16
MPNVGPPTISTKELYYAFPDGSKGLQDINLDLPANARCLLIGGKHNRPIHIS